MLFLGAGVSVGAGMPSWNGLLEALAMSAGIDPDAEEFKRLEVLDKAEILRRSLGEDRFRAQIREHFSGHHQALAHQLLASLPVTEAATTNYDTLFEEAWRSVEPEGNRVAALPAESPKGADRWLLKLHGSVEPDGSELVLCREDYLRLGTERAALSGVVHAMLLTRHMLFVGFSLTDDTFHRIAHEVRAVLGPPAQRPGSAPFGTALTPTGGDLSRRLWEGDPAPSAITRRRPRPGIGSTDSSGRDCSSASRTSSRAGRLAARRRRTRPRSTSARSASTPPTTR